MSSGDITRYVVTVNFHEGSLTDLNEINNAFSRANFLLTMTDEEGTVHELGPLTFGLISAFSQEEVSTMATGLVESATDKSAEIDVDTWETWKKKEQ